MLELTVLAIVVAIVGAWFFFKKASPTGSLDVNKDGKVNVDDVKAVADVNKDGKVTEADAKAVATETVVEIKQTAVDVKTEVVKEVKKTVARNKKAAVKKLTPKAKK